MLISEVLRTKGHNVVKIRAADSIRLAVRMLAEHRIGSLVVEDQRRSWSGYFRSGTLSTRSLEMVPQYLA